MAIINNPQQDKPEEKKTEGIIKRAPVAENLAQNVGSKQAPDPKPNAGGTNKTLVWIVVVLLGLAIAFGLYSVKDSLFQSEPKIDPKVISLEIERMVRISGLMELLETKIAQGDIAVTKAKKIGDQALVDTMRLNVARNLEDLERHQDEFIVSMEKLYAFHQENPEGLTAMFKSVLQNSKDAYKVGNTKTIEKVMGLLSSVPEEKPALEYFTQKVKKQKDKE